MATPEQKARQLIDAQLEGAGWIVQDRDEMNLGAGLGVAVREYPLAAGPCDYLLFVDRRACGVIEAKPEGVTLSGVADQASGYQDKLPGHLGNWGDPLRFDYEASGSEILFSDRADHEQRSRYLFGFHQPATLLEWLKAGTSLRGRLQGLPPLDVTGLRDCQTEAITALEASLAGGKPRALVQMTMGAGKTFTAATLAYRLLAHADAKRVLFLVDRNNLGRQTLKEFQAYRPPGTGRLFTELYNVQRLGTAGLDRDAKVVISTIQRVFAQLSGQELSEEDEEVSAYEGETRGSPRAVAYSADMPPETFDVVIVDECHRSIYGTWRQVLEYFDAFTIGLTATPSAHTLGYFQKNLVAEYPYERAVIDGVNVPFEVFRIRTEIGERGGRVPAGFTVPRRDRHTRRQRYEELTDDLIYAPSELDRSVIAPNQIRTVLETYRDTLSTELFPGRDEVPKTLIFAKDDHHAEEVVHIAREVFGKGNEFAKKITYNTGNVDPETLIAAFRNSYNPRIAVTVDMIATGTDIKPVEVLVFLRDVKSALYFEQMKGRGVRTVADADLAKVTPDARTKDRFVIIDAVGVTESAKTISAPMERERVVAFDKLLEQVASGRSDPDVVSTLAARLAALDRKLTDEDRARVAAVTGGRTPKDIAAGLLESLDNDRIEAAAQEATPGAVLAARFDETAARLRQEALRVFDDPRLRKVLIELKSQSEVVIDEFTPDAVISTGFDAGAAEAMTGKFRQFLDENQDELTALSILYGKPYAARRLTYESLEELRSALARPPWLLEPAAVWHAYKRLSNGALRADPARVLTDVVALVRYALGQAETLAPLSSEVAGRFNLWIGREERAGRAYTAEQRAWLEAIRDHLAANVDLHLRDLQELPQFAERGGVIAARQAFGSRLDGLIEDLSDALVA
ncbi:MAG: DEAD/DEAH box helicase family protein [Phenylobacterium sp.]|uniref:type I restriction endonuclease subunit R n=1 Tax=Phenylobacterium sp. TaxID=1871053 RepID=UPI001A481CEE|nr:DEAD/DEAH box helicase family protein [Phenylobacterium sp.]MBL8554028.1 DEAD/DEAH box helicase family protein [Phenylobacterium sp.]